MRKENGAISARRQDICRGLYLMLFLKNYLLQMHEI